MGFTCIECGLKCRVKKHAHGERGHGTRTCWTKHCRASQQWHPGIFLSILAVLVSAVWVATCEAGPARSRSLEEALFEEGKPLGPGPVKMSPEDGDGKRADDFRSGQKAIWASQLGAAALSEDAMPLRSIAERMVDVQGMLARAECGANTQHTQREIIDNLDRLLREAQKRCQAAQASCCKKPGDSSPKGSCDKPGTKSGSNNKKGDNPARPGENGSQRLDATARKDLLKELWGELPPRERERMLQMPVEEFLPEYEAMIEAYFRKLSEEKGKKGPE